jgi:outer membrane protein assembly factor BamE (lipoprotein component of BamABCDE complex)
MMKALALMVAIALALAVSGCMTHRTTIDSTKVGTGTVPQTRVIEI